jgi:hypothetical protein
MWLWLLTQLMCSEVDAIQIRSYFSQIRHSDIGDKDHLRLMISPPLLPVRGRPSQNFHSDGGYQAITEWLQQLQATKSQGTLAFVPPYAFLANRIQVWRVQTALRTMPKGSHSLYIQVAIDWFRIMQLAWGSICSTTVVLNKRSTSEFAQSSNLRTGGHRGTKPWRFWVLHTLPGHHHGVIWSARHLTAV